MDNHTIMQTKNTNTPGVFQTEMFSYMYASYPLKDNTLCQLW